MCPLCGILLWRLRAEMTDSVLVHLDLLSDLSLSCFMFENLHLIVTPWCLLASSFLSHLSSMMFDYTYKNVFKYFPCLVYISLAIEWYLINSLRMRFNIFYVIGLNRGAKYRGSLIKRRKKYNFCGDG